jgi:hypothetical protein
MYVGELRLSVGIERHASVATVNIHLFMRDVTAVLQFHCCGVWQDY